MKTYVKPEAELLELKIDEAIMGGVIDSTDQGVDEDW